LGDEPVYIEQRIGDPDAPVFSTIADNGLPPVLFIHGFLSSRAQWRDNLEEISKICRPFLVDLLGHGRSPSPDRTGAYSIKAYLGYFETFREKLGVSEWAVIGQSFGAGLALHYALDFPGSVKSVVFTNSISAVGKLEQMPGGADGAAMINRVRTLGRVFLEQTPFHTNKIKKSSDSARAEMARDAECLNPEAIANTMEYSTVGLNVRNRLAELSRPVVLVNGTREKAFQPVRDWITDNHSNISVIDLDGGHSPNVECASQFNEVLQTYLSK